MSWVGRIKARASTSETNCPEHSKCSQGAGEVFCTSAACAALRASLPGVKLWQLLTIIVASSPVPSNPDTSTLRAVFASFRTVTDLASCPKVMQFDGY